MSLSVGGLRRLCSCWWLSVVRCVGGVCVVEEEEEENDEEEDEEEEEGEEEG